MALILFIEQLLNGIQFGIMLFLISAGSKNLSLTFLLLTCSFSKHRVCCCIVAGLTGSFWIALAASLCAAAIAGVLIEVLIIRHLYKRDHLDQVLATFALILLLSEGVRWLFGAFPLYLNIPSVLDGSILLPFNIIYSKYRMFIILIGILIALGLYFLISKTRLGIRIRAGQNDREMISALGVDISKLYTIVFAIGAALAGLAGAMIGAIQSIEVGMGEPVLILAFVVIIIGGIGSIKGAFIGSILVGVTDTIGRVFLPNFLNYFMESSNASSMGSSIGSMLIYILMASILLIKPSGLFGKNEK